MVAERMDVTGHYINRAKERMGANMKQAVRASRLARERGKRAKDCKRGVDREYLEKKSAGKLYEEAVAYNGFCFIFDTESGICITVYPLPKTFGKKHAGSRKEQQIVFQMCYGM